MIYLVWISIVIMVLNLFGMPIMVAHQRIQRVTLIEVKRLSPNLKHKPCAISLIPMYLVAFSIITPIVICLSIPLPHLVRKQKTLQLSEDSPLMQPDSMPIPQEGISKRSAILPEGIQMIGHIMHMMHSHSRRKSVRSPMVFGLPHCASFLMHKKIYT